jgi:hypothetical protein
MLDSSIIYLLGSFSLTFFATITIDMKANNYEVVEAGETIIFRGLVQRSRSQAFFLVFCTAIALASLALVLQIQFQDLGTLSDLLVSSFFNWCMKLSFILCQIVQSFL